MDAIKKNLQLEISSYEKLQNDGQKHLASRQMLEAQLAENTIVDEEMKVLSADAKVYKLVGPVLVKQSREEAALNVEKRLSYIQGEIKRHEELLSELETKKSESRDKIAQLQQSISAAKA